MQGSDKLVYGLGPLWVVKADGTTSSFARDGGKSVRAEVNGSGTVTASFRYRAYGAISQSSGASTPTYLGYAGQLQDPSGLLYMRARWYDPATGRFTTRDPGAIAPVQPAALNSFGYAYANPLLLSDPTGVCVGCLGLGAEAAAGALAVGYVALAPITVPATVVIVGIGIFTFAVAAVVVWAMTEPGANISHEDATEPSQPRTGPIDPQPQPKDLKDVRGNKRADKVAQELGYEGAEDMKDQIDAGSQDIVTVNKKTGDVWVRRPGSSEPGDWVGIIEP
jgi:RHS repeat-associated protein